jgi:hypothetical protein
VEDETCDSPFLAKYSTILKYDFCDNARPSGHNNGNLCGSFGGDGGYWAHWPSIDFGMASVRVRFTFEDLYLGVFKGGSETECGWTMGQIGSLRAYTGMPSQTTIIQLNWRNRGDPTELGKTIHTLPASQALDVAQLVYWWVTASTVDTTEWYHPSGRMIEIVLNSRGDLTGPNGKPFGFTQELGDPDDGSSAYLESATITRPFYFESDDPLDDSMWFVEAEIECQVDVRYRWGSGQQFTGPRQVWTNY